MEKSDQALLLQLAPTNYKLRRLYQEHVELEDQLAQFERFPPLTTRASLEQRALKKRKLRGMDAIMGILNEHRAELGSLQ
ncbi:MAG: DUF465 domain-containing protein [Bdellovibrionales bacterium]|nr:DUF465 domain-containing protein [Bdellovibrionales bacterium]